MDCQLEENAPAFCERLRDLTFPVDVPEDSEFTMDTEALGFEIHVNRVGDYLNIYVPQEPHPSGEMYDEEEPKTCETYLRGLFGNLKEQNEGPDAIVGLKYKGDEDGKTHLRISRAELILNNIL